VNFQQLETEGGKTAIVLGMLFWLSAIAVFMHETGHDPAEVGREVMVGAISSLLGILYGKLGNKEQKP
jgi:hypothetical protein